MRKSWQNIYDEEIMTKHVRRDSVWKFMRVEMRVEKRWDLTIYPKHYFLDHLRSCLTKHLHSLRWRSHDKTCTMKKSWQNIYDEEIMTKHIHSLRWRSFDKTCTMKKSWQNIYVHIWQNIYTHYDEEVSTNHLRRSHDKTFTKRFRMKIHEGRNEGRNEVRSNHLP